MKPVNNYRNNENQKMKFEKEIEKFEKEIRKKMIKQKEDYDKMKEKEGDSDLIFNEKRAQVFVPVCILGSKSNSKPLSTSRNV